MSDDKPKMHNSFVKVDRRPARPIAVAPIPEPPSVADAVAGAGRVPERVRSDPATTGVTHGPSMPTSYAPPSSPAIVDTPAANQLVQPPTASTGTGSPRQPRRKIAMSDDSVYISGPRDVINRFRQFHSEQQYAAYHDSLTALMNLAERAIANGLADD